VVHRPRKLTSLRRMCSSCIMELAEDNIPLWYIKSLACKEHTFTCNSCMREIMLGISITDTHLQPYLRHRPRAPVDPP
jgi:hypothetical protein